MKTFATLTMLCLSAPAAAVAADRDPFQPPFVKAAPAASALERFDLSSMSVEGLISGIGSPIAAIRLPDGDTQLARVGTRIGVRGGTVVRISGNGVVVSEPTSDARSEERVLQAPAAE